MNIGLPPFFVATPESANNSTHSGASGSAFTRVTGYGTTDCSQCRTSSGALEHMRFRGLSLLSGLGARSLRPARIKPSLLHCPGVAFIAVLAIRTGNRSLPIDTLLYGLVQREYTMAKMLSGVGYATGAFGKWHLGHTHGCYPTELENEASCKVSQNRWQ